MATKYRLRKLQAKRASTEYIFPLGNRFETLYLPSSILIVEGKCDHRFIERVVTSKYPNAQISVVAANSDGRIKEILSVAKGLLTDIQKSPYRDRIFVVLDLCSYSECGQVHRQDGRPKRERDRMAEKWD